MNGADHVEIVDSHTHLDDPAFDVDREEVLATALSAGVRHFVNVAYIPERWESSRALRDRHSEVKIALGVHPQHADDFDPALAEALKRAVRALQPAAIGETGFDFTHSGPTPRQQKYAFHSHLEIAATEGLPVIIHQRNAGEMLMDQLDRWLDPTPIVLHSFEGDRQVADWAVERGYYIGVGGLATRRSSARLREVLGTVPHDRLLLETDSPYLAPAGAGTGRNSPGHLADIAERLAPLWSLTREELCAITSRNAKAVFNLDNGR